MATFYSSIISFLVIKLEDAATYLRELDTGKSAVPAGDAGYWLAPWGLMKIEGTYKAPAAEDEYTLHSNKPSECSDPETTVVPSHAENVCNESKSSNPNVCYGIDSTDDFSISPRLCGTQGRANVYAEECMVLDVQHSDHIKDPHHDACTVDGQSLEVICSPEQIDRPDMIDSLQVGLKYPELEVPEPVSVRSVRPISEPGNPQFSFKDELMLFENNGKRPGTLRLTWYTLECMYRSVRLFDKEDKLVGELFALQRRVARAQSDVESLKNSLEDADNLKDETVSNFELELAEKERLVHALTSKIRTVNRDLDATKSNAHYECMECLRNLRGPLGKMALFATDLGLSGAEKLPSSNEPEPETQHVPEQVPTQRHDLPHAPLCLEDLYRESVRHALNYLSTRLDAARSAFNSRGISYLESYEDFKEAFENGETGEWTWDDWHVLQVDAVSRLTRDLVNAEQRFDDNLLEAKKLGLWNTYDDWDASSGFFDQPGSCGYGSEFEAALANDAPEAEILAWRDGMEAEKASMYQRVLDELPDDARERIRARDAQAVDMGDDWDVE